MRGGKDLTVQEYETLQQRTFLVRRKNPRLHHRHPDMILHGIRLNILHTSHGREHRISREGQVDVVLANPPFGEVSGEIQENFPVRTSETAYLFLQHFIKILRKGGSCGVVIKLHCTVMATMPV